MFRPISVPDQNANNVLKRYSDDDVCCNDYPAACQYDVTIPTANAVNNIIFRRKTGGATVTKTFSPAVTGAANVIAAIRAALVAEGYENDGDIVTDVTSAVSGSNTIYSITGSPVVVSMLHNTSTTVTATAKCDRVGICDFYLEIPGATTNTLTVDGVDASLGSLTLAGNTAANVVSAIEGAANWPAGYTVTVVEDADSFNITINGPGEIVFEWSGVQFDKQNCVAGYIA